MGQELNGALGSWVTLSDPFPALGQRACQFWYGFGSHRPLGTVGPSTIQYWSLVLEGTAGKYISDLD